VKKGVHLMMKYYIHHVPGRLRVRIPSLQKDPRKIEDIKAILQINGIQNTKVNPLTGSIVINYDPDILTNRYLLDVLKTSGFFREDRIVTLDTQIETASNRAAKKVGRAVFGWAIGRVLESNGLSLIAAFI
jgi:copper chaperone CopZ